MRPSFVARRTLLVLAAAVVAAAAVGAAFSSAGAAAGNSAACSTDERRAALAAEQAKVLALVGDLTTLDDESDLGRAAARGWGFATHWQASVRGMGFALANVAEPDVSGNPTLLLYAPSASSADVTDDRFDFPYTLRGWAYAPAYVPGEPPRLLTHACIEPDEWFVHERGVHDFETRDFVAVPPEEDFQGDASGADPPAAVPPDVPHSRLWDIHFWLGGDGIPAVSMLNPGQPLPGHDPQVGVAFFYPPSPRESYVQRGCHEVVSFVDVDLELADAYVPDRFEVTVTERGNASVILRTASCDEIAVGGGPSSPARDAKLGIQIRSPYGESRLVDAYALFLASDDADLVKFLRRGTGLGARGVRVPGLVYAFDALTGDYRFEAPAPTPSPFVMHGVAGPPLTPVPDTQVAWWVEHDGGAVGFLSLRHVLVLGAADVTIEPAPGTQLARLLATAPAPPVTFSNAIADATTAKVVIPCGADC